MGTKCIWHRWLDEPGTPIIKLFDEWLRAATKSQSCFSPEPWSNANLIRKAGQVKWCSRKALFGQIHTVFHGVSECSFSALLPYSQGALVLCGRIYPSGCNSQGCSPSLLISFATRFWGSHCICLRSWECGNMAQWTCGYLQQEVWIHALLLEKGLLRCLPPFHGWQLQLWVRNFCCRSGRKEVRLCWPQACSTRTGVGRGA